MHSLCEVEGLGINVRHVGLGISVIRVELAINSSAGAWPGGRTQPGEGDL